MPLALLRDGGRPLLLLLGVALILKLVIAMSALAEDPLAQLPTSDAAYYLDRASGLAGVEADPLAAQSYHLPPLYPRILASLPGVVHGEFAAALLLQAAGGTLLLALTYILARRRISHSGAMLAAALTLFYGPLSFYETRLLGDSLACLALLAALVAADALAAAAHGQVAAASGPSGSKPRGVTARAALLGALLALAALLRPQALLLLPVLLLWAGTLPHRPWLACAVAAVLVLLPSAMHNLRASGDVILVSDNGGVNLWLANTGPLTGTFGSDKEAFGDIASQADVARSIAEREAGHALSDGAVSGWFVRSTLSAIASRPGLFLQRVLLRARALTESFETDIASFPETGRGLIAPLRLLALPFGVLLGLCLGAAVLGARWRRAPRLPMLALGGMVVLTALLFFHYSRFRLPLIPLLAIGGAAAWDRIRAGHTGLARGCAALAVVAAVTLFSQLPAAHHATTRANGLASTGQARLALARPGDLQAVEAALADAHVALAEKPGFSRALLLQARASLLLGRWAECLEALDSMEQGMPGHAATRLNRGFLYAVPDPGNPYHDPAAAAAIVAELQAAADSDPTLVTGLEDLKRMLGH